MQPSDQVPLPLTIIIPTYNRAAIMAATVEDVRKQSFTNYELWIVDQSQPEQAAQVASFVTTLSDSRIKYLHISTPGLPNSRNEGLRRARGEIILFLDDDVILLTPDFLSAHLAAYEDPKVGGVTGRHVERLVTMNEVAPDSLLCVVGRADHIQSIRDGSSADWFVQRLKYELSRIGSRSSWRI